MHTGRRRKRAGWRRRATALRRLRNAGCDSPPAPPFDVIVIDPPWSYYGSQSKWGAAAKHYPTLPEDEIAALPLRDLLSDNGVVFIWATGPKLDAAIRCIAAWGLSFRGVGFVWIKTSHDGVPWRARGVRPSIVKPLTEFVLCASAVARGRPLPVADEAIVQTVFAPVGAHSEKPAEVQARIEQLYPDARRLEMYARAARAGWASWGYEAPSETAIEIGSDWCACPDDAPAHTAPLCPFLIHH